MIRWLLQQFHTLSPEPMTLDHVPVNGAPSTQPEPKAEAVGAGLALAEKLALAAQRHGKPFKHAADGLPRLVTKDGMDVAVGVLPVPNVTTIKRRTR